MKLKFKPIFIAGLFASLTTSLFANTCEENSTVVQKAIEQISIIPDIQKAEMQAHRTVMSFIESVDDDNLNDTYLNLRDNIALDSMTQSFNRELRLSIEEPNDPAYKVFSIELMWVLGNMTMLEPGDELSVHGNEFLLELDIFEYYKANQNSGFSQRELTNRFPELSENVLTNYPEGRNIKEQLNFLIQNYNTAESQGDLSEKLLIKNLIMSLSETLRNNILNTKISHIAAESIKSYCRQ